MKILVTGAHGLLGTEFVTLAEERGFGVVGLARADLDVTDPVAVSETIAAEAPDWVIHCAAYTAVDGAEEEPAEAMKVNRDGAGNVARAAAAVGAAVVYISSDYVFDGGKQAPYLPSDPVGPESVYARSKLAGEEAVLAAAPSRALVVRTGWLYGAGGRNFVRAILERAEAGGSLRIVDDQRGRPTWARNVARTVLDLVERNAAGVWHVADRDDATWLEFAQEALRLRGLDVQAEGVSTEAWGAAAPRPRYSVLDLTETESMLGREMVSWREALSQFLNGT